MSAGGVCNGREYMVVQSSFGPNTVVGYFPKDRLDELGIMLSDSGSTFFNRKQSEAMHAHPEWIDARDWDTALSTPSPERAEA